MLRSIVEAPIPDQDPIDNLQGIGTSIKLGLNFNQVRTNSAMTHLLVLSAKVRRNDLLWHALDISNVFGPTSSFKHSQTFNMRNKITKQFASLLISIFLKGKITPP